ncbi:MAG: alkene reductase [Oscillatoriales cyanobacterium RM1_1_9]|nr:alkene reductase [Oscillatoriales cyanobacterium SM2_3_0]NJO47866.1 alkene reductase [Oscillatoriales cyanobacterium RM2_1_1]NJO71891.1 alkene reductase [Oscillatoriales cyanobacterium RM1_1_9]
MNTQIDLFSDFQLGELSLPHRIVMAPLTRMRAGEGNVPQAMNAEYYAQRASAALIISEATQISPQGMGYPHTPGIHSAEQVEGWKRVTQAVHDQGGRMFLQLWHVGRVSHPSLQPNSELPVAPSAIAPEGMAATYEGEKPFVMPRALETAEIPGIVETYKKAAKNAMKAGFNGVEIHSANGYLLDEFLQDGSNKRTDKYGGSIENRVRFLLEVTEAVTGVWGREKVGVRLSPSSTFMSISDSNPQALFSYVAKALNSFDLAYLHIVEPRIKGDRSIEDESNGLGVKFFRPIFKGNLITAGGFTRETGNKILAEGDADLVAYGRLFIANPDLPKRFRLEADLNAYDRSTFYAQTLEGYIDYPTLEMAN